MTQDEATRIAQEYLHMSGVQANIYWDARYHWFGGSTHFTGTHVTFPCDNLQLPEGLFRFVAAHEVGHVVYSTTYWWSGVVWVLCFGLLVGGLARRMPLWGSGLLLLLMTSFWEYTALPPRALNEWLADRHALSLGTTMPPAQVYGGPILGGRANLVPTGGGHPDTRCPTPTGMPTRP